MKVLFIHKRVLRTKFDIYIVIKYLSKHLVPLNILNKR